MGSALRRAQFATAFRIALALVAHMGGIALAHLVLLAGNGGVNGVLLGAAVGMLLHRLRCAGLTGAGSKQMLS